MLRRPNLSLMLDQITKMLDTTRQQMSSMPAKELPPGILDKVSELEFLVSQYVDLSERLFSSIGYKRGEIEALINDPSKFAASDQRNLARAAKLKEDASKTYYNLSLIMKAVKKIGNLRSADPKKRSAERAKKFGRVGGKKGWTPL